MLEKRKGAALKAEGENNLDMMGSEEIDRRNVRARATSDRDSSCEETMIMARRRRRERAKGGEIFGGDLLRHHYRRWVCAQENAVKRGWGSHLFSRRPRGGA